MRVVGLILLGLLCATAWSAEVAPEPVKMDVFGDPVPPGALWRAGSSRFFSAGEVQTVAYSPSSKFFATANDRGTISLWDPESGKVLRDLKAPAPDEENPPTISELIFTPDESLLLAREDKGVRVWHLNGTKEHFFIEKDGAELKSMMALSPDGKRLALCFDSTLFLYETATGQLVETVKEGATLNQPPYALIFSADGRSLVLARKFEPAPKKEEPGEKEPEKKEAEKTEAEKEKNPPPVPPADGPGPAPIPDAPQVTEYSVLEWLDAATLKTIRTSKEVGGVVTELVVSPDNRYIATQSDDLKLWNAATGELIKTDETKKHSFGELKFTPDSKWLAGIGEQEHVGLLTVPGLQTLNSLYFGLYESSYSSFDFAPDMKHMVLAGSDRPLRMLALEQGMGWVRHENVELPGSFQGFTFSPDAKTLVAGCENKSLHFVDIETRKETHTILNMAWDANKLQYSSDGKTLYASDSEVKLHALDLVTDKEVEGFKPPAEQGLLHERCHKDGQIAVMYSDGNMKFLDGRTGEVRKTLNGGSESVVLPDPKGESALVMIEHGETAEISLWDVATQKRRSIWSVSGATEPETLYWPAADQPIFYSTDGEWLRAFDPASGQPLWSIFVRNSATCMDLSPDGSTLAVCYGDMHLDLLDPKTGEMKMRLVNGDRDIHTAHFHPNGKLLITSDRTGILTFWEPGNTILSKDVPPPPGRLPGNAGELVWTPDGKSLIAKLDNAYAVNATQPTYLMQFDGTTGAKRRELGEKNEKPGARNNYEYEQLRITPDGQALACWEAGIHAAIFIQLETGRELKRIECPGDLSNATLSEDAKQLLLTTSAQKFTLVQTANDQRREISTEMTMGAEPTPMTNPNIARIPQPGIIRPFRSTFTPNGRAVLFGVTDQEAKVTCQLLDLNTNRFYELPTLSEANANDWTFTPDGQHLYISSARNEGSQEIVEVSSMQPVLKLPAGEEHKDDPKFNNVTFSPDGRKLACGTADGKIFILDRRSGVKLFKLAGHTSPISALAFSPDSRLLASSAYDSQILCWKVPASAPETPAVTAKDLEEAWEKLGDGDAFAAHQALLKLVSGGDDAVHILREHIKDLRGDSGTIKQLIADLDNDESSVREKASNELIKRGHEAEPQVRAAFENPSSLEVKARCRAVLDALKSPRSTSPMGSQRLRAIIALEWIGSPLAADALKALSKTAIAERERNEAKFAMERLEKAKSAK